MPIPQDDATPQLPPGTSPWIATALAYLLAIGPAPPQPSDMWPSHDVQGHVWALKINEISGLAPAQAPPNAQATFWAHNDSGGPPELYLLSGTGAHLHTLALRGIDPYDMEDIAAGPCPLAAAKGCLYLGDIGDNRHRRDHVHLYLLEDPGPRASSATPRTILLRYPDGPQDAESLLVHPVSGEIFVVSKAKDGRSKVWGVPKDTPWHAEHDPDHATELEHVAALDISAKRALGERLITAADFSPDGRCAAFLTYRHVWTFCMPPDEPWQGIAKLLEQPPDIARPPQLLQPEALTWDPSGRALWLSSERNPSPLVRLKRDVVVFGSFR